MLAMLIEFAAFIRLRMSRPLMPRPYRIPLGTGGVGVMLTGPVALLAVMFAMAPFKTWAICGVAVVVGCGLYFVLHHPATRRCCVFLQDPFEATSGAAVAGEPVMAVRVYGTEDLGYVLDVVVEGEEEGKEEGKEELVVPQV